MLQMMILLPPQSYVKLRIGTFLKTLMFDSVDENEKSHQNNDNAYSSQVAMNPVNTVFDAKRLIGRRFDDSAVQSDMKHWPFKVINDSGKPKISVSFPTSCLLILLLQG